MAMNIAATGSQRSRSQLIRAAIGIALATSASTPTFAQERGEQVSEVVITGSRIVRRDYESQSPIVTVGTETIENRSSTGIESTLNQLPQFTVAANGQANSAASTPFLHPPRRQARQPSTCGTWAPIAISCSSMAGACSRSTAASPWISTRFRPPPYATWK